MKIYLHIGWHKTGTTAVQRFMHQNRRIFLEKYHLNYPESGLYLAGHHPAAWLLQENTEHSRFAKMFSSINNAEDYYENIFNEATALKANSILISSEEFDRISDYDLGRLASILKNHDVTIISYVRRQDRYIESKYNQLVKSPRRETVSLTTFIEKITKSNQLNYFDFYSQWSSFFGKSNLVIRLYERDVLPHYDVIKDICAVLATENFKEMIFPQTRPNASLSFQSIEFLRRVNSVGLTRKQHVKLVSILKEIEKKNLNKNHLLLGFEDRLKIIEHYKASNDKFFATFLNDKKAFELTTDEIEQVNGFNSNFSERDFTKILSKVNHELLASNIFFLKNKLLFKKGAVK
jgi:hypothetical protein